MGITLAGHSGRRVECQILREWKRVELLKEMLLADLETGEGRVAGEELHVRLRWGV